MEYMLSSSEEECTEDALDEFSFDAELEELSNVGEIVTVHPSAMVPLPFGIEEKSEDVIIIDPSSSEGRRMLSDPETRTPELFALLRQFVAPVCDNINLIVNEMLNRDVGVNDIDVTTGMTMLHYVVRAECISSDKQRLTDTVRKLLLHGADISQRTMLTDMTAIHIAAFFDCPLSLEVMINEASLSDDVDSLINGCCTEFDFACPLHLCAFNLSVNAAEVLLKHGADRTSRNNMGKIPEYCIPDQLETPEEKKKAEKMKKLFKQSVFLCTSFEQLTKPDTKIMVSPRRQVKDISGKSLNNGKTDLEIGDMVLIGGSKRGRIQYIGQTRFAPGIWCGVELNESIGKNDGSINGVRYFTCEPTRGVFAPASKVVLIESGSASPADETRPVENGYYKPNSNEQTFRDAQTRSKLKVGMTVWVDHLKVKGRISFLGETDFSSGVWVGLSLRQPLGKNNGTVQGKEYFKCKPDYGIMLRPARVTVDGIRGDELL